MIENLIDNESNFDIIEIEPIIFDSDLVGRIVFWDEDNQNIVIPNLVPNKLGNLIVIQTYNFEEHQHELFHKSFRPIYIYLETLNYLHYVGLQGIYDNKNKTFSIKYDLNSVNKFDNNFKWFVPSYMHGKFIPLKSEELFINDNNEKLNLKNTIINLCSLPEKDSNVHLDNYLRIEKNWFNNLIIKNHNVVKISPKFDIYTQIGILWKINLIYSNDKNFIVNQTMIPNNIFKNYKTIWKMGMNIDIYI